MPTRFKRDPLEMPPMSRARKRKKINDDAVKKGKVTSAAEFQEVSVTSLLTLPLANANEVILKVITADSEGSVDEQARVIWSISRILLSNLYLRASAEGKMMAELLNSDELDRYMQLVNTYLQCRKVKAVERQQALAELKFKMELEKDSVDVSNVAYNPDDIKVLAKAMRDKKKD